MKLKSSFYCLSLILFIFSSCKFYTFSGVDTGEAKTVSIEYIVNRAALVSPTLSQTLTENLKTKFVNETRSSLIDGEGDLNISGSITGFAIAPVAVSGGNQAQATQNRLTITVNIIFTNKLDDTKNFEQTFSNFKDFDANLNFSSVESTLIAGVTEFLVQEIFNRAVINW